MRGKNRQDEVDGPPTTSNNSFPWRPLGIASLIMLGGTVLGAWAQESVLYYSTFIGGFLYVLLLVAGTASIITALACCYTGF